MLTGPRSENRGSTARLAFWATASTARARECEWASILPHVISWVGSAAFSKEVTSRTRIVEWPLRGRFAVKTNFAIPMPSRPAPTKTARRKICNHRPLDESLHS